MGRIFLVSTAISLAVDATPALAEKHYKMSCEQFCREKHCSYGNAWRWDMSCMGTCVPKCIQKRADENRCG